jgi:hypothetical protein
MLLDPGTMQVSGCVESVLIRENPWPNSCRRKDERRPAMDRR